MDAYPTKVGRIVFAIPFAIFGVFHFLNAAAMAGMVPIPGGVVWVYLTGVAHLAAAISFIVGKYGRLAGQLLALMLLIFALSIHLPAVLGGDQASMTNFLKDVALAGGALVVAGTFPKEIG